MEQPTKLLNRNFFLLWQGQLVSRLGTNIYGVAMALLIKHTTESATLMGLMWTMAGLPMIILGPIAGTVADRYSRRKILIYSDILNGLAVGAFTIFLFRAPESSNMIIAALFFVTIFIGITNAFFNPAVSAAIPDIVPKSNLAGANSMGQVNLQLSTFIGQGIGAMLFTAFGAPIVCLINGISYLYAGISKSFIVIPQKFPEKKDDWRSNVAEFKQDLVEGFRYVWKNKGLRMLVYVAAVTNLFSTPIIPLLPFFVEDSLHVGDQWYGFLLATTGIGSLAGYIFAGVANFPPKVRGNIMMVFIILQAAGYGILGLMTTPLAALSLVFLGGFTSGYVSVNIAVTLQITTPSEIRGRVMALLATLVGSLMPIGMGLGGYIGDLFDKNIPLIFGSCGVIMAILTIIAAMNKNFRDYLAYDREIEVVSDSHQSLVAPDLV